VDFYRMTCFPKFYDESKLNCFIIHY
jgi:hypothetical protein